MVSFKLDKPTNWWVLQELGTPTSPMFFFQLKPSFSRQMWMAIAEKKSVWENHHVWPRFDHRSKYRPSNHIHSRLLLLLPPDSYLVRWYSSHKKKKNVINHKPSMTGHSTYKKCWGMVPRSPGSPRSPTVLVPGQVKRSSLGSKHGESGPPNNDRFMVISWDLIMIWWKNHRKTIGKP